MFRCLAGLFLALFTVAASLGVTGGPAGAQATYGIKPGDVLQIQVLEDSSLNRNTLVLPDGSISFPLAGTVRVGGQSLDAVQAQIIARLAPNFAAPPTVFVSVESLGPTVTGPRGPGTMSVYIIGEAASPGKKDITPGTTLLQFLAQSGGFTKFAATKRIQLRRTNPKTGAEQVVTYNYRAIQDGEATPVHVVLAPGDVIVVPERRLFE